MHFKKIFRLDCYVTNNIKNGKQDFNHILATQLPWIWKNSNNNNQSGINNESNGNKKLLLKPVLQ